MQDYKVLVDDVQVPGMEGIIKDAVIQLEPDGDVTKELLAAGSIELVVPPPVEQAGDICTTEDGKEGTLQGDPLVCVATVVEESKEDVVPPPASSNDVPPPVGPQKFLEAKLIIEEGERVVGEKTYRTVLLADGSSHDLTDEEYETRVEVIE